MGRKLASRLLFFSLIIGLNAFFLFWIPEISLILSALAFILGLVVILNCVIARMYYRILIPVVGITLSILALFPALAFKYGRDHAFAVTLEAMNELGGNPKAE